MDASQKRSIIHRNFSKGNTSEIGDIILECNHCSMKYKHRKSGPTTSLLYHLKVSSHDFLYIILISLITLFHWKIVVNLYDIKGKATLTLK